MDNLILFIYNFFMVTAFITLLPFFAVAMPFVRRFRLGFWNYFGLLFPAQRDFVARAKKNGMNFYLIHGVSVGEIKLAKYAMAQILRTDPKAVFALATTSPDSFAEAVKMRFENRVLPLFFPLDIYYFTSSFLKRISPVAVYILEVDLWPNFILAAAMRSVPVYLLNGRISDKTLAFYSKVKSFTAAMLSFIDLFFMQSEEDARRVVAMGADEKKVIVIGNMKFDIVQNFADREKNAVLYDKVSSFFGEGHDHTFVCGSTHEDEEETIISALEKAAEKHPGKRLLCVIAPRNISRASNILSLVPEKYAAGLFSDVSIRAGASPSKILDGGIDFLIMDSMGYLMSAYSMADAAIVGGTFCKKDIGGHNIIEPAVFGIPVLYGPSVRNFRDVAAELKNSQIVFEFSGAKDLADAILKIMDPEKAMLISLGGKKLLEIVERNSNVTGKIFTFIKEHECKTGANLKY